MNRPDLSRLRPWIRAGSLPALVTLCLAAFAAPIDAQAARPSNADPHPEAALRAHIEHLASEQLEGRLTGTDGERAAAAYLSAMLREVGASPLPGYESFEQPFEFTAGSRDTGSGLGLTSGDQRRDFTSAQDVLALAFSEPGVAEGDVVFAGYGLEVPDGNDFGYDSYAGLDVRDKIVLVLRYSPEDATGEARATLARYSGLRYKAMLARRHGARALLVVTGPRSAGAGETVPMTFDTAAAGSGIVAASIGGEVARAMFAALPGERDLESVQRELDSGNPHIAGFALTGLQARVDVRLERERREGINVVGMLRGAGSTANKPYVVVGGHYDHLGRGRGGNSLARVEEVGGIHHGADDNASGVAAVLEVGRALGGARFDRHIVLAFWSGEELGLLGSNAFLQNGGIPPGEIAAYLNLDMVGRMRENRLTAQGAGSSPAWARLLEQANVLAGFDLAVQADPYLPTDSAAFYGAEVPTLNLFTGAHEDYHRPTDRSERVNVSDLARITDFTETLTLRLANADSAPEYVRVEQAASRTGDRDSVRAFTGTIPDYSTEVEGLLLGGVIGGGPAEAAGLRAGDVIVRFGDHEIKNIYDYTFALDSVKVDQPVEVVYLRDGQRLTITLTPRARR
ncbi:MAG TPA: M20/M25/M40 family metallo-hydrolase [Thermoanaerobaculia bacterium]|nr:M20/M25/M40 family metallo-hydrolase [Thermoanaerobaculia bacterium]